jgi:hypothetical protein
MLGLFRRLSSFGQEHTRIPKPSSRQAHPQLEALEERCVPSTLTVSNLLDSGSGSLRGQIAAAASGDTIQFAQGLSGKITLTGGEIAFNKSLPIQGPGAGTITVDGNNASRIFDISGSSSTTVTISGLTLTHGHTGSSGGAIDDSGATLTIADSVISGNFSGDLGGALNVYSGTVTIQDSTISGNTATSYGGGVCFLGRGILTIVDSTISGNQGGYGGGVILYNSPAGTTFRNCTISGNTATRGSKSGSNQTGGGGILLYSGSLTLDNCTIAGNTASTSNGGGIWVKDDFGSGTAVLTLRSTIVAGNSDRSGAEDVGRNTNQSTTINASNDLIQTTPTTGPSGTINGTNTANIFGQNPLLGPLQNNGGSTQTMALSPGSSAIDTGSNPDNLSTDQRGFPRTSGAATDIGAFEFQAAAADPPPPSSSITVPPPLDLAVITVNTALAGQIAQGLSNAAAFADPAQVMTMQLELLGAFRAANLLEPAATAALFSEEALLALDLALFINAPGNYPPNAPETISLATSVFMAGGQIASNPLTVTPLGRLEALELGFDLALLLQPGMLGNAAFAALQSLVT